MKKGILLIICLLVSVLIFAQAPQVFNYQGVARGLGGDPLSDQPIGLRISILSGSPTVTTKYTETHSLTTNELGLFDIQIGEGNPTFGTFQEINWGTSTYFLQIEIDENADGNYQIAGVSQLLSVPYALYAKDVENDRDNQTLSISGDNLTISSGNTVTLPSMNNTTPAFQQFIPIGNVITDNSTPIRYATSSLDGNTLIFLTDAAAGLIKLVKDEISGQYYYEEKVGGSGESLVILNNFLYRLYREQSVYKVKRYTLNPPLTDVVEMNLIGGALSTSTHKPMYTDGNDIIIYNTSDNWIRFSISGTDLINAGTVILSNSNVIISSIFDGNKVYHLDEDANIWRTTTTGEFEESISRGANSWNLFGTNGKIAGLANINEDRIYLVSGYSNNVESQSNNLIIVLTPFAKP